MKNLHTRPILLILVTSFLISIYCTDNREQVESNTPPFDPLYFRDTTRMHVAVFFDVQNGDLSQSTRRPQVRPGGMPYHSRTTGDFVVVYKDAANTEIGRYATQNPTYIRTCDLSQDSIGELRPIVTGIIEILTPFDRRISYIQIIQPGDTTTAFYVQIPHFDVMITPDFIIRPD